MGCAAALAVLLAAGAAFAAEEQPLVLPEIRVEEAAAFADRVREDAAWLGSFQTRVIGSEEHDRARDELLARVRAIPGVEVRTQEFQVVVPKTLRSELTIPDGPAQGTHRVYPIWPSCGRLNSTPTEGIEGQLVYIGKGEPGLLPGHLPARSLRGQIAVMEMTGGERWMSAFNAGAQAIILLGSPDVTASQAGSHLAWVPINVPRFYVPDGPLAEALRRGEGGQGTVVVQGVWTEVTATNIFALVMPKELPKDELRQAFVIGAAYDSISVIPELAPGATAAVNAAITLNALRYYAEHPPMRPVLCAFIDAYAINQRGVREMLGTYATIPSDRKDLTSEDESELRTFERHEQLAAELCPDPEMLPSVEALRQLHLRRYGELQRYLKDETGREVVRIETAIFPLRILLYRLEEQEAKQGKAVDKVEQEITTAGAEALGKLKSEAAQARAELDEVRRAAETVRAKVKELSAMRTSYYAVERQLRTKTQLRPENIEEAQVIWGRARKRIHEQYRNIQGWLKLDKERDGARMELWARLSLPAGLDRPIGFLFSPDLSDSGIASGPSLLDLYAYNTELRNAQAFTRWIKETDRKSNRTFWPKELRPAVSLYALEGTASVTSDSAGMVANFTSAAPSFRTAGVTWGTLNAPRVRVDTPNDRVERLDWGRLTPQIEATYVVILRAVGDAAFIPSTTESWPWGRVRGTVVDQAPGEPVPRIPMPGYLTTLVPGSVAAGQGMAGVQFWGITPGVRRLEYTFTGIDGRFRFDLCPSQNVVGWYGQFVQSFLIAPDGRIVRAVDMAKQGTGVTLGVRVQMYNPAQIRAVAFDCAEMTGLQFIDPRYLLTLPSCQLLDAARTSAPQRVNMSRYSSFLSFLMEPGLRWQLILRHGITANQMVLLNMADPEEVHKRGLPLRKAMFGFRIGEPLPANPTYIAARDFYRLDRIRLDDYRTAGITSQQIERLQTRTEELLKSVDEAYERDDGAAYEKAATGALANEVRVYQAVRETADDVTHGAIFLLLMIVPFAFVMERLLFATPNVYRQIGAVIGIFAVMTAVLWSFHPAFRLSSQPLMIIMAFGAIGMSILVISMVYSKFEGQLEELRSGRAEGSGARTSRFGLAYTAIRLGIANMRKRKLRTALTSITIVLITFALLCFMSVSQYTSHKEMTLPDVTAERSGVLIALPTSRPMSAEALVALQNIVPRELPLAPRYWWCEQSDVRWRLPVRNPLTGKQVDLKAGLGLSAAESDISGIDRVCPNWAEFAKGDGCYLAATTAEALGVKAGDRVFVQGRELKLVGTYDAKEFGELKRLDGEPLRPLDFTTVTEEQRQQISRSGVQELDVDMAMGAGLERSPNLPYANADQIVVLPADMMRDERDCTLRSVGISAASAEEAQSEGQALAGRLGFPIYYGAAGEKVRVITSTPLLPQAPRGGLIVALAIAGLIILNTMLSSIAERKREIYIYTSLGLAPLHVGFLFLAEAITYGLMGAIFGYVAGQGVAKLMSGLGLMGGITLNYSGAQAIYTMMMVLGVVIVSSLVPAFLAGKLATPSNEMSWKVPAPVDDVIRDRLPFTATERTAGGVLRFLFEYMDAHREGAIGNFSTDDVRVFRGEDGRGAIGIAATVWLAPYDLGVRQELEITIGPSAADPHIHEIDIRLQRQSGQVSTWWKLNRVLLADLRKQLLGWRKLKIDRMLEYITRAAENQASGQLAAGSE